LQIPQIFRCTLPAGKEIADQPAPGRGIHIDVPWIAIIGEGGKMSLACYPQPGPFFLQIPTAKDLRMVIPKIGGQSRAIIKFIPIGGHYEGIIGTLLPGEND